MKEQMPQSKAETFRAAFICLSIWKLPQPPPRCFQSCLSLQGCAAELQAGLGVLLGAVPCSASAACGVLPFLTAESRQLLCCLPSWHQRAAAGSAGSAGPPCQGRFGAVAHTAQPRPWALAARLVLR